MDDAYLLDTSVATIAWNSNHQQHALVQEKLAALGDASISVCAISVAEVLYGQEVQPYPDPERLEVIKKAMGQYRIWNIDRHTVEYYAKLRGELFKGHASRDKKGRLREKRPEELIDRTSAKALDIQENDLWIVSVAVQYDLVLITRDKKMRHILEIAGDVFDYDSYEIWDLSPHQPDSGDQ